MVMICLLCLSLSDYYEEMLALLDLFTCEAISPLMWQMFGVIFDAFNRDGFDYFSGKAILCTQVIMLFVFFF